MPDDDQNPAVRAYDGDIMGYSAASPVDGAVFYSGRSPASGEWNRKRALAYVAAQPPGRAAVIDQTPCGKNLVAKGFRPEPHGPARVGHFVEGKVWEGASKRFALEAYGRTTCFVDGSSPGSTFREKEFPALLANSQVSHVNGLPRAQLKNVYDQDHAKAFRQIEGPSRDLQPQRVTPSRTKSVAPTPARRPLSREAAGLPPSRSDGRERGRNR